MYDITSPQNPLIKRIRSLRSRKGRTREGVFWVEGILAVLEAVDAGWPIERIVLAPDLLTSDVGLESVRGSGLPVTTLSRSAFERISGRDGPQGLGAVARIQTRSLADLRISEEGIVVVLESSQDPGNVGSVVRTASAAGAEAVILIGRSTDAYDPASVRASMGSLFSLPTVVESDPDIFVAWARDQGVRLIGTSARSTADYTDNVYQRPLALVFGNEQKGLSGTMLAAADAVVGIPLVGRVHSLNLAAAAAVVTFRALEGDTRSG